MTAPQRVIGGLERGHVLEVAELGYRCAWQHGLGIEARLVVDEQQLFLRGRAQHPRADRLETRVNAGKGGRFAARNEDVDLVLAAEVHAPVDVVGCGEPGRLDLECMRQARARGARVRMAVEDGETLGGIGLTDEVDRGVDGREATIEPDAHGILLLQWGRAVPPSGGGTAGSGGVV